jgi:hypothetical protein
MESTAPGPEGLEQTDKRWTVAQSPNPEKHAQVAHGNDGNS